MKEGWIRAKLGDVGEVFLGGTPRTSEQKYWCGLIPWITPADLSGYEEKYISKGRKSITNLGLQRSSARLIPTNSILFSSRAPIGYVAIAKNELSTNQGFKSFSPFAILESEFVYYYLKSIKSIAEQNASGTTFKEISAKSFCALPIEIPPLPEQHAIVAKIEQLFSELDNGTAHLKAAKEKLEIYRQSVLKMAFDGKLLGGEKDNPSNIVHKGWRQETISAVCEVNPPKPVTDNEAEITFLPMSSVEEETGKYCSAGTKRYEQVKSGYTGFLKGDVLFAKITPCMENGKVALIDKLPNQIGFGSTEFHVVRPSKEIGGKYLFYFLVQRRLRSFAKREMTGSAGQLRVPKSFIQDLRIPLPPLPEQRAIVSTIKSRFAVCDKLSRNIDEALEKSQAMRQSILKKAFDGGLLSKAELRECREQPDWEPAEKLLQRIKANKPSKPAKRKK